MLPIIRDREPPCESCAKGVDPDNPHIVLGPDYENDRPAWPCNIEAYMMYRSVKLMGGAARVPEHLEYCSLFHEVMLIVDQVVQLVESERLKQIRENREREQEDV